MLNNEDYKKNEFKTTNNSICETIRLKSPKQT